MGILVVDDDPYIQRSLTFVLKKEGFEVDFASNGEEAIRKTSELRPEIIFLDIMMPKINGFNVCKTIKSDAQMKNSYIIVLTAKGQEVDKEICIRNGADEFITKPFSPKEIVSKVRNILKK